MTSFKKLFVYAVVFISAAQYGCASTSENLHSGKTQSINFQRSENMNVQENKKIAERFMQIWGKGSLDIIDELGNPDIIVQYPAIPQIIRGTKMFRQVMQSWRSAFPDSDIAIEDVIAENDKAVIRWVFTGTHRGNLLGIPATGKEVKITGITIYRIIDGKVVEERGEEDFLGVFRQLGLLSQN